MFNHKYNKDLLWGMSRYLIGLTITGLVGAFAFFIVAVVTLNIEWLYVSGIFFVFSMITFPYSLYYRECARRAVCGLFVAFLLTGCNKHTQKANPDQAVTDKWQECMDSLQYKGTDAECEWCDYISTPCQRNITEVIVDSEGYTDLYITEIKGKDTIEDHLEDLIPYEAAAVINNSISFDEKR